MGKKAKAKRQANAWIRFNILANLAVEADVSIHMLNERPMHVRVTGACTVDYWPATERAWIMGASQSQKPVEVAEVLRLAQTPLAEPLTPEASSHLKAIARET